MRGHYCRALGWVAIGVGLLGLPAFGYAQTAEASDAPSEADLARARDLFNEGLSLAQQADHRGAIAKFREVMHIRATSAVKYNLAVQLVQIEELAEADVLLQQVLEDETTEAQIRSHATDLRLQIEEEGGRLKIELGGRRMRRGFTSFSTDASCQILHPRFECAAGITIFRLNATLRCWRSATSAFPTATSSFSDL